MTSADSSVSRQSAPTMSALKPSISTAKGSIAAAGSLPRRRISATIPWCFESAYPAAAEIRPFARRSSASAATRDRVSNCSSWR